MALFDIFMINGADSMFMEGQSFRAVASFLRNNGLSFSDKSLRDFRDTINGDITLNLSNFGEEASVPPEYFTTTKDLPCGEYGIAVNFIGYSQASGEEIHGRTFERVDSFSTISDFFDSVSSSITDRALNNSDIVISSMSAGEGYIGEC